MVWSRHTNNEVIGAFWLLCLDVLTVFTLEGVRVGSEKKQGGNNTWNSLSDTHIACSGRAKSRRSRHSVELTLLLGQTASRLQAWKRSDTGKTRVKTARKGRDA